MPEWSNWQRRSSQKREILWVRSPPRAPIRTSKPFNMQCEGCDGSNDGSYGSGRFCSKRCACSFATRNNREQINAAVSNKLRGRKVGGHGFKVGYDPNRGITGPSAEAVKAKISESVQAYFREKIASTPFDQLSRVEKKKAVLAEQGGVCLRCGLNEWLGEPLTLELDHADGNHSNNDRSNLRVLCPNCHSQTPTYCKQKRLLTVIS